MNRAQIWTPRQYLIDFVETFSTRKLSGLLKAGRYIKRKLYAYLVNIYIIPLNFHADWKIKTS